MIYLLRLFRSQTLLFLLVVFTFNVCKIQAQCSSCTTTINSNLIPVYTVTSGQTVCIAQGFDYTGSIVLSGGTLCNQGTVHNIIFNSGDFENYGTYSKTSGTTTINNTGIVTIKCNTGGGISLNKLTLSGSNQLTIDILSGAKFIVNNDFNSIGTGTTTFSVFGNALFNVSGDVSITKGTFNLNNSSLGKCVSKVCLSEINFSRQFNVSGTATLVLVNNDGGFINITRAVNFDNSGSKTITNRGVINMRKDFNISGNGQNLGSITIDNYNAFNIANNLNATYTNGLFKINNYGGNNYNIYATAGSGYFTIGGNFSQSQANITTNNAGSFVVARDINIDKGVLNNRGFIQARSMAVRSGIVNNGDITVVTKRGGKESKGFLYLLKDLTISNPAGVLNNVGTISVANEITNTGTINLSASSNVTLGKLKNQVAGIIKGTGNPIGSNNMILSGNWMNNGIINLGISNVTFNGAALQTINKPGGFESFYQLSIDKPSGVVSLSSPVKINSTLTLTRGIITSTSSAILELTDNAILNGGSDLSYVSGPVKKTGDEAFTFPLGDIALALGAYHPLSITAPENATDAFTGQYFATKQMYGDSLQTDSLESISNCEYWLLKRVAGSSVVSSAVGWNSNSCNVENFVDLRLAGWDGTRWVSLGNSYQYAEGVRGTLKGPIGLPISVYPIVISKPAIDKVVYAELKRKLDGGLYYMHGSGKLYFKYDEEYNDADNKLSFKIYANHSHELVFLSDASLPVASRPSVFYGDNRYQLNIGSYLVPDETGFGIYILEVINEKNEKRYLRFTIF